MPAAQSLEIGGLPIGLAHNASLVRDVAEGAVLTWADVRIDPTDFAYRYRREMEAAFQSSPNGGISLAGR
jgi:predicted homoserine dehydrogenase-like protein